MPIISDYHIHTHLCGHATGEPSQYLEKAYQLGFKSIGIADHGPLPIVPEGGRMEVDEVSEYNNIIENLRNNEYGIDVLYGMEVDWIPEQMNKTYDFLDNIEYDYLIGSLHYVDMIPFDHSDHIHTWNTPEKIEYVWDRYPDIMFDMINSENFDIIGHIDIPKKFLFFPETIEPFYKKMEKALKCAGENGTIMELNTGGLRKKVNEIYPNRRILEMAKKHNVRITFNSDAHTPEDVGANFSEAAQLAKSAGYTEYCVFSKDKEKIQITF